jgi:2-oxoglutarate dehydrogenase E2 component (dihydrolipoamide succinyltransferase)
MSQQPVLVPNIGESIKEVTIASWRKAEGDAVTQDEPLVEVESDKATVEIPAPVSGVLRRIIAKPGDTVAVGAIVAEIEAGAVAAQAAARPTAAPVATPGITLREVPMPPRPPVVQDEPKLPTEPMKASPSTRRLIAESGVDVQAISASGPAGRIERQDVLRAAEPAPAPVIKAVAPDAPTRRQGLGGPRDRSGQQRVVRMTPLRRTVARRLIEAQQTAAILTTFNEVNMEGVMNLRTKYQKVFTERHGIKLGFMSFFVKAAVEALKAFPAVNAEVSGDDIVYKDYYDIGVAVGGGKGLVVPVVRDCERLSLAEIEKAIAALATKAKENRLTIEELQGGTFTISNGGIYGSMMSTPILNPPQSGILGLHSITKRAMVEEDAIVIRSMMYVALSYDHRIIDGREAVQFLVRIKECIEDPERLLIEV